MRIFLGKIPHSNEFKFVGRHFFFSLAYCASILKQMKYTRVFLVGGEKEGFTPKEYSDVIQNFKPDIIVFETSEASIKFDLLFCSQIKQVFSKSLIVLCGSNSAMYNEKFLQKNQFIDFVMMGEYEYILRDLIAGVDFELIDGLIYRGEYGEIIKNNRKNIIKNIDNLPWPAREFLITEKLHLLASRGSPFKFIDKSYRARDSKLVADELEIMLQQYGYDSYCFDDEIFNFGKYRVLALCEEIKKRNIKLPFSINAKPELMDFEMLRSLKDTGLSDVKYNIDGNINLDQVLDIIRITKELEINVYIDFSIEIPNEIPEKVYDIIYHVSETAFDFLEFNIFINGSKETRAVKNDESNVEILAGFYRRKRFIWDKNNFIKTERQFVENLKKELMDKYAFQSIKNILVIHDSFIEYTDKVINILNDFFPMAAVTLLIHQNIVEHFEHKNINILEYNNVEDLIYGCYDLKFSVNNNKLELLNGVLNEAIKN